MEDEVKPKVKRKAKPKVKPKVLTYEERQLAGRKAKAEAKRKSYTPAK